MRRIIVFDHVSAGGYFATEDAKLDWVRTLTPSRLGTGEPRRVSCVPLLPFALLCSPVCICSCLPLHLFVLAAHGGEGHRPLRVRPSLRDPVRRVDVSAPRARTFSSDTNPYCGLPASSPASTREDPGPARHADLVRGQPRAGGDGYGDRSRRLTAVPFQDVRMTCT